MIKDQEMRPPVGIVATLAEEDDVRVRLIFDDVVWAESNGAQWRKSALFTAHDFDREKLESGGLSTAELADIGFNLITRLVALGNRPAK